mmetsp:Transcript_41023/g.80940  ORF Transcript_41023/g.80940 Transcript_41023/m.80940 type:complete len:108 (+) Transcript_41023:1638-1961(+)
MAVWRQIDGSASLDSWKERGGREEKGHSLLAVAPATECRDKEKTLEQVRGGRTKAASWEKGGGRRGSLSWPRFHAFTSWQSNGCRRRGTAAAGKEDIHPSAHPCICR